MTIDEVRDSFISHMDEAREAVVKAIQDCIIALTEDDFVDTDKAVINVSLGTAMACRAALNTHKGE